MKPLNVKDKIEELRRRHAEAEGSPAYKPQDLTRALAPLQKADAAGIQNVELRRIKPPSGTKAAHEIWADGQLYGHAWLPAGFSTRWKVTDLTRPVGERYAPSVATTYLSGDRALDDLLGKVPSLIAEGKLQPQAALQQASTRKPDDGDLRRAHVRAVRESLLARQDLTPEQRAFIEGRI